MKQFIYDVLGEEFVDTEAFGKAWREAKAKATALHAPIYRLVVKGEKVSEEVYVKGGCFLPTSLARITDVMIF